jgi:hypothetical protein
MAEADMPALAPEVARRLMDLVYAQLILRLQGVLQQAVDAREIRADSDAGLLAGALIGLIESFHAIPDFAVRTSRLEMATKIIDILLKGLDYHEGGTE